MRQKILAFLSRHPRILSFFWCVARAFMRFFSLFVPVDRHAILFQSFGGRNFDDSPRAIYDEICRRPAFDSFRLIWAFTDPAAHDLPRGKAIRIDTPRFFFTLLRCGIWVGNSEVDRGIGLSGKRHIWVETWHGTPLKKIGGEENENSMRPFREKKTPPDCHTIRCAQSQYDREIFARIFHAAKDSFLLCDLPRNDVLLRYTEEDRRRIRAALNIPKGKRVLLYMPTYREYAQNENGETYLAPPITPKKWEKALGDRYVFLLRAHYAVTAEMQLPNDGCWRDVSDYPVLSELYAVADVLLSDYSSAYVDFSILEKPMLCFAYDEEEYTARRGLYLPLRGTLPCPIHRTEDGVLHELKTLNYKRASAACAAFHRRFTPYAGRGAACVVDEIEKRMQS